MGKSFKEGMEEDMTSTSLKIPTELYTRMTSVIPWGVRSKFLQFVIASAVDRVETGGLAVIGGVVSGQYNIFQTVVKKEKEGGTDGEAN